MRTTLWCLVLIASILYPSSLAQRNNAFKYDVTSEIRLKGTVEEVREIPNSCMGETGTHLMLRVGETGVREVQVAPRYFLADLGVRFAKGDQLEVTASKIKLESNDLLLARQIVHNGDTLVVRDPKGEPAWTWMKKRE